MKLWHASSVSCKSVRKIDTWLELSKRTYHSPTFIPPPIVNGSTSTQASLALCVYCLPALLVLIGSIQPSDRTMFAFAVCLGKSLLSSNGPSYSYWYKVQRMPASSWCGAASSCGCTPKFVRNFDWVSYLCVNTFMYIPILALLFTERGTVTRQKQRNCAVSSISIWMKVWVRMKKRKKRLNMVSSRNGKRLAECVLVEISQKPEVSQKVKEGWKGWECLKWGLKN